MSADELIVHFVEQFPAIVLEPGIHLFDHQQQPEYFFFIQRGFVKMSCLTKTGDVTTLHIFGPGSCISLLSLVDDSGSYEFETLTPLHAFRIPRQAFVQFAEQHPEVSFALLLHVLKGMNGLLYRIHQTASVHAYERVASLLLYFADHFGSSSENPLLLLSLTHQDISEWFGLTRENVSIQMKKLERAGYITYRHHLIEVRNLRGLKKLVAATNSS